MLGATGLVGGYCLDLLLEDPRYTNVGALVRRPVARRHPKLRQHVVDYEQLADHRTLFAVTDIFCCLGTTIRKAGSREAFWRVDVEYPVTAGRLGTEAGAVRFLVVSALGADPDSRIPYNRAKGEMESRLRSLPIDVWIFRPGLLLGPREELRVGERVAQAMLRPLSPLLRGRFRRYRPVHARTVAAAMLRTARLAGPGRILESEEL